MTDVVVLLWLGTSALRIDHQPDIDAWGISRLVELREPAEAIDLPGYDPAVVDRIEGLLDRARLAVAALDEATARARLGQAERLLRAHAMIPQAAWLMAERLSIEASLYERLPDGAARARSLRQRAEVLEGRRATVFTGGAQPDDPEPAPSDDGAIPLQRLVARGLAEGDVLWLDGQRISGALEAAVGEHHARVTRRGAGVWGGWVQVTPDTTRLFVDVPRAAPCSVDDLAGTRTRGNRVLPPPDVRCPAWAVARPAPGGIEVARCWGGSCHPLMPWSRDSGAMFIPPAQPPPEPGFPAWATWTLLGVGAAAVTGYVLWQAGTFSEPERGPPVYVWGGVERPAWRF